MQKIREPYLTCNSSSLSFMLTNPKLYIGNKCCMHCITAKRYDLVKKYRFHMFLNVIRVIITLLYRYAKHDYSICNFCRKTATARRTEGLKNKKKFVFNIQNRSGLTFVDPLRTGYFNSAQSNPSGISTQPSPFHLLSQPNPIPKISQPNPAQFTTHLSSTNICQFQDFLKKIKYHIFTSRAVDLRMARWNIGWWLKSQNRNFVLVLL